MDKNIILRSVDYKPSSGIFTHTKNVPRHNLRIGDRAGTLARTGYIIIRIAGKRQLAHRVAWFLCHGTIPNKIDHINGDKTDNRISNLRDCTDADNAKNRPLQHNNKSGLNGVRMRGDTGKWSVTITAGGVKHSLGCFTDFHRAALTRLEAEEKFNFHENHGRL